MHRKFLGYVLVALAAVFAVGFGCGGGSKAPAGRAQITVRWNNRDGRSAGRLIPLAANSIKITLSQGSDELDTAVMTRPSSGDLVTSHTFENLPIGDVVASAKTFASQDGTGPPLSANTLTISVGANATTNATITLASTIVSLVADYTPTSLVSGDSVPVTVSGRDVDGNILPITTGILQWATSDSSVVTATGGTIAYVGPGTATVTATDPESTLHVDIPVTAMSFSLSATTASLSVRGSATFTGTIVGPADTAFTWSKVSGVGTFNTSTGAYSAGNLPGSAVLRATSHFDPTRTRDINVTVQSGSANIGVQ